MQKIRVMITDDHPTFREGLARLLRGEVGIEVVATPADGLQALEAAKILKPDIAIMDISMPKLNGIEAAKQIRDASPNTAILMVSSYNYPFLCVGFLKGWCGGIFDEKCFLI